jgi:hypothetical protein
MKRTALLAATAAFLLLTAPCGANAQGVPPGGGPDAGARPQQAPPDPQAEANRKAEQELEFKNRKAEMEMRITHQMEQLEKSKSCVAAAATMDDLHKCMPMGRGGMMGMGMRGGMMGGPGGGMGDGQQPPPGGAIK